MSRLKQGARISRTAIMQGAAPCPALKIATDGDMTTAAILISAIAWMMAPGITAATQTLMEFAGMVPQRAGTGTAHASSGDRSRDTWIPMIMDGATAIIALQENSRTKLEPPLAQLAPLASFQTSVQPRARPVLQGSIRKMEGRARAARRASSRHRQAPLHTHGAATAGRVCTGGVFVYSRMRLTG